MVLKSPLGQLYRLGNRLLCHATPPLGRDRVPGHSLGHLLQYLRHHDPRTQERRLAMTDLWISDDVAPQESSFFSWHVRGTPVVMSDWLGRSLSRYPSLFSSSWLTIFIVGFS